MIVQYRNRVANDLAKAAAVGRTALQHTLRTKTAYLGGDPSSGFEQSFASLAFTHIREKAPALLDYMIGFQLVEKSQDNQKAIGIFGFKFGNQWAYAPVFFLNGDLRGHEMLWLKSQDIMVPLKENWINAILAKQPNILGSAISENQQQLGIQQPNLNSLSTPPGGGKFANDRMYVPPKLQDWAREVMPHLATLVTKSPGQLRKFAGLDARLTLTKWLERDLAFAKCAFDITQAYPGVSRGLDGFYPEAIRSSLITLKKRAADQEKSGGILATPTMTKKPAPNRGILGDKRAASETFAKVEVITDATTAQNVDELSDADREKLLRDGVLIRDHRDGEEVSVSYNTQTSVALTNPDGTGIYEVLVKPGEFKRCLIVQNARGPRRTDGVSTVVDLSDNSHGVHYSTEIFAKEQGSTEDSGTQFRKWLDEQTDVTALQEDAEYIALLPGGQGTSVFVVNKKISDGSYDVSWRNGYAGSRPTYLPSVAPRAVSVDDDDDPYVNTVVFGQSKGRRIQKIKDVLYLPEETKCIKLTDQPKCDKCDKSRNDCDCDYFHHMPTRSTVMQPGNLADLQLEIMKKAAAMPDWAELKVWTDGNELVLNRRRMSKLSGLIHLVRDHGLRVKQARHIITEATRAAVRREKYSCLIKYAQPYMGPLGPYAAMGGGPSANMSMEPAYGTDPFGTGLPSFGPTSSTTGVDGLSAADTDPSLYDPMAGIDPMAMQVAQQSAQMGQKEIFDTAMVSSLLKSMRNNSFIDEAIPDLVAAMDRLGRILFLFYWHSEQFAEQYGKHDLPELAELLRNAFEMVGDTVLYLKNKNVTHGTEALGLPDLPHTS